MRDHLDHGSVDGGASGYRSQQNKNPQWLTDECGVDILQVGLHHGGEGPIQNSAMQASTMMMFEYSLAAWGISQVRNPETAIGAQLHGDAGEEHARRRWALRATHPPRYERETGR